MEIYNLSIYLQSLAEKQQKENVEIKDGINCWFSSSNQRLGTQLLRVLIKTALLSPIIARALVTNLKTGIK